jgi:hypothetical protein
LEHALKLLPNQSSGQMEEESPETNKRGSKPTKKDKKSKPTVVPFKIETSNISTYVDDKL